MFPKVFNIHSGSCEQRLTKGTKELNFLLCVCVCVFKYKLSKHVKYAFALIF